MRNQCRWRQDAGTIRVGRGLKRVDPTDDLMCLNHLDEICIFGSEFRNELVVNTWQIKHMTNMAIGGKI